MSSDLQWSPEGGGKFIYPSKQKQPAAGSAAAAPDKPQDKPARQKPKAGKEKK